MSDLTIEDLGKINVVAFLLADHAEASRGKLHMVGGGWDRLRVARFPAVHTHMSVVVALRVPWAATDQSYQLAVRMLDPEKGDTGRAIRGGFQAVRPPEMVESDSTMFQMVLNMNNTRFERPGRYTLVLELDDEPVSEAPITVIQQETPADG